MPLGFERLNARIAQPNPNINFIKPLEGSDKAISQDFLERLAAGCNPITKKHHIYVMSLEEFPPNREFWGRNFNAGEVIQLVLKAPGTNRWLSFEFVQMVLMHELAHCKQMNHSKAFWKVRNAYSEDLHKLWAHGYTGEGMWSRGVTLASGQIERQSIGMGDIQPKHLCGGTFRTSGKRKRKAKPKASYQEQKERRIAKKFGVNGVALGADDKTKVKLEKGKQVLGKPRVAGSARGRDLRAAAALARCDVKTETPVKPEEGVETESEGMESESENDGPGKAEEAVDTDGKKLVDAQGRGMVRVCADEDRNDLDAQNEMAELQGFNSRRDIRPAPSAESTRVSVSQPSADPHTPGIARISDEGAMTSSDGHNPDARPRRSLQKANAAAPNIATQTNHPPLCPVCSMRNDPGAATCVVCAHVLDAAQVPSAWSCQSETCRDGKYLNAGDCGVCGVCGARKCSEGN